jgi:hypothetical protein
LPDDGKQQVVGESYYQPAFHAICRGKTVPRAGDEGWEDSLAVAARLVAEHDNPHDPNAVRVDVQGKSWLPAPGRCGHTACPLAALQETGKIAECEGRIVITYNGDYSIYLHLSDSDTVAFALQLSDDVVSMTGPWLARVSGEEAHQDVLGELVPTVGGEQTITATLAFCTVRKGKYAGQRAVEVRISGRRVGELSRVLSDRYAGRVRDDSCGRESPSMQRCA